MSVPVVVDTNVPLVAKGLSDFSDDCVERCIDELTPFLRGERRIVLDTGDRILEEYMHELSLSGQPTVGDAFLKWLYSNQAVEDCCEKVELTVLSEEEQIFEEFPVDPAGLDQGGLHRGQGRVVQGRAGDTWSGSTENWGGSTESWGGSTEN